MSITQAAQLLRQQGRGKDSELMHVTPNEVNALQGLARAHGGSLTTNPQTGLPEAGFLEDVLPTVIGTAVGTAVGMPWLGAAIGGGLSYATTGSLEKGLMSGLGAFGGASALSSVGALGAGPSTVSSVAGLAPEASIAADTANFANIGNSAAPAIQGGQLGITGAQNCAQMGAMDKFGAVGDGFSKLIADPSKSFAAMGGLKGQGANLAMMGAPLLSSIYNNNDEDTNIEVPPTTIRPAAYDPKTQQYTQLAPVDYNDWGDQSFVGYRASQGYADGGAVDDSVVEQRYAPNVRTVDPAVTQYNQMLMNQAQQEYVQGQPMTGVAALAPGVALGNRMQAARDAAAVSAPETGTTANTNTKSERIYDPVQQMYIANPNYVPPPPPVDRGFSGFGGYDNFNGGNQNDGTGDSNAGNNSGQGENAGPGAGPGAGENGSGSSHAFGGQVRQYNQGGIMSAPTFQEGGELASDAFIVPADVVSALGNGSTDAGVRILNQYLGQAMKVEGAGDGLSDDINASIEGGQPARIADGEVYIDDARVAELGGGDSERGAAMLYAMMDKVRESAHGKKSQQKEVNPEQVMPV